MSRSNAFNHAAVHCSGKTIAAELSCCSAGEKPAKEGKEEQMAMLSAPAKVGYSSKFWATAFVNFVAWS